MKARTVSRQHGVVALASGVTLLGATALVAQAIPAKDVAPTVGAKGAVVLEGGKRGSVFSKNADMVRPQASTVKIMVASVVLDTRDVDLDREVPVRKRYHDYVMERHASSADLQTGDRVTVRQLLYASLLPSGADAAYALADTFGTGATPADRVRSFVALMNTKAGELGLRKTIYKTFDGSGKDASTPRDLAKLAGHAMQNDVFREVVGTRKYKGGAPAANGRTRTYTWANTNLLLGEYDGVIGLKTGTTKRAGECLVFAAKRGARTLVGAVLNSEDRFLDTAKLLDDGFGSHDAQNLKLPDPGAKAPRD